MPIGSKLPELKYSSGKSWQESLGVPRYRGDSYVEFLQHVRTETAKILRAYGLDPDFRGASGDQQHLLTPYQRPLIQECHDAYLLTVRCLSENGSGLDQQRAAFRLGLLWSGQELAAISGPLLLAEQRRRIQLSRARKVKVCPYTQATYDAALAKVGPKQELLAKEIGIDRKTLRKWGRPT